MANGGTVQTRADKMPDWPIYGLSLHLQCVFCSIIYLDSIIILMTFVLSDRYRNDRLEPEYQACLV